MSFSMPWSRFGVMRLKHLAAIRASNVDKIVELDEASVRLCNYTDVYYNERISPDMELSPGSAKQAEIERFRLRRGDILITKDSETPGDIAVPALVTADMDDVVCGYHLALIRPKGTRVISDYLLYVLKSKPVRDAFTVRAQGITRFGLTLPGIGSVPCPLPSLETQKLIAGFLGREVARINQLIEKKRRILALLVQKRRTVVSAAVLGGEEKRRNAVPWLAFMPEHWDAIALAQLVQFRGGSTPSKEREDYWAGDIPWVSPKDMKSETIKDSEDHITRDALAQSSLSLIGAGAVLIVTRGMILARTVPVAALAVPATINQDMKALVPRKRIRGAYLLRLLEGLEAVLLSFVDEAAHGTKKLRTERLFKTRFPVPPVVEQAEIERHISLATDRIFSTAALTK